VVPHIQRSLRQKSSSKVLDFVFWDRDEILLLDYPEKGTTVTAKYCVALDKLEQQFVSKR
jgi:hypothetical protein